MKDETAAASSGPAITRPNIIDLKNDLNEYAWDYHSDELQITLRFVVENHQLKLFGRKSNDPVAYPIAIDHFFFKPGMELSFTRDERKRITGFSLAVRATNWSGPPTRGMTFTRLLK